MCGIAGIFGGKRQSLLERQLFTMANSLAHRGPDDEGFWTDQYVGLTQKRLAIIDTTSAGKQPMVSKNERYVLIYNGEIYNFREIRKELLIAGHHFTLSLIHI